MTTLYNCEITPNEIDSIQWSELTSIILEKIYSFLNRDDQVNMSLVCRNWSVGYGSPSVWKTFKFELSDLQLSTNTCPVLKFVPKYGHLFRHVEIRRNHRKTSKNYLWCKHLIDFLQLMRASSSQIISVKFHRLLLCFRKIAIPTRRAVYKAIAYFLGSQQKLKLLLDCCFDNFEDCVGLFREINGNSKDSIKHLTLGALGSCQAFEEKDSDVEHGLLTVKGLQTLTRGLYVLEYSMIFENTLTRQSVASTSLPNPQTLALSKIIITHCYKCDEIRDYGWLKSINWMSLKEPYPDLQVELYIEIDTVPILLENLILPGIPITLLEYVYENPTDYFPFMEPEVLFKRLLVCQANDHLLSLHLIWGLPIRDMADTFIPFLQACKKLERLGIITKTPVNGLHLLLEAWLKYRPQSLKKVFILISGFKSKNDIDMFENSTADYVSRLQLVDLHVEIELR